MQNYWASIFNVNGKSLPGPLIIGTFEKRAPGPLCLFACRKRSLPSLTVDATIGNRAFSYDRCFRFPGIISF